jgi:hypothetical protein
MWTQTRVRPVLFFRSSSSLGKLVSSTDELANDLSCVDRRMFLMAALQEISGKERELATDPDCVGGLERIAYSMGDFVRRVFMDSLTGS